MPLDAAPIDARAANRTSFQHLGDAAEEAAAQHLVALGWQIVARKLHVGRAEIDLLGIDPGPPRQLVLVEVRWRARRDFGLPEETVTWRKQRGLRRAFGRLLEAGRLPDGRPLPLVAIRIDVIAVEPGDDPDAAPRIRHHRWAVSG